MSGFIAVHVGAGYHAENRRPAYKSVCRLACKKAANMMKLNIPAIDVITEAVTILEDSPLTNAGIGSNLTLDGIVECDAGIMDGQSLNFGSVGALNEVKNPIKVALEVLKEQNAGLLSCGRIPPCTVVGKGAVQFAQEHGFSSVDQKVLTTKASYKVYAKSISMLQSENLKVSYATESASIKHNMSENFEDNLLDTVGAVCIDKFGNVASAVSSGGLMLKHSGRVGQSAIYGAGCWAQNGFSDIEPRIAVSVSGAGEYLIKTIFAKECFHSLYCNQDSLTTLPDVFKNKFLESPFLKNVDLKLAGALTLKYDVTDNLIELAWAHTTKTMILGCMSTTEAKPHSFVSEQPYGAVAGKSIVACGKNFYT